MRRWVLAALAAGALAAAGCGDDSGGDAGGDSGGGSAGVEQTCAAAEQAMTELGASMQTALNDWDGTPENAGEITAVTDQGSRQLRELAGRAADQELRTLLDDLAAQLDEFGASWAEGSGDASLAAVDAALQPLDDRCGFGAGAELAGEATGTPDAP